MGRKTNSVSLRLKKTNRDYNNCWYGDILYTENFSKSLKIGKYLSQTLKTIGLPIPQLSVVGAFKKASLLVCYLDPKKRQRLLEKSSKAVIHASKAFQNGKVTRDSTFHGTKRLKPFSLSLAQKPTLNCNPGFSFFSLGDKKQEESKASLKPSMHSMHVQSILDTDSSLPYSLQHKNFSFLTFSSSTNLDYKAKVAFEKKQEKEKKSHAFKTPKAKGEQSINGDKHEKLAKCEKSIFAIEKSEILLNIEQNDISKKLKKKLNCSYHGSIGLEFLQNKQLQDSHGYKENMHEPLTMKILAKVPMLKTTYSKVKHGKKVIISVPETIKQVCCMHSMHEQTNAYRCMHSMQSMQCITCIAPQSKRALVAPTTMELKRLKQENGKERMLEPTTFSSLNNTFFIKKHKKAISSDLLPLKVIKIGVSNNPTFSCMQSMQEPKSLWKNPLSFTDQQSDFLFCKKDKQEKQGHILGPKFFPYIFENTAKTDNLIKFKYFSDFFCNNKNDASFLFLISTFSKNSKIFGKKINLNHTFPFQLKPFRSKLVYSASNFNFSDKVYIDNLLFSKKEKNSLTGLIGFYNGFSRFWENVVSLSFYRSTNETSCALFLADTVSYLLEKKVLFRSIKRQLLLGLNQSKFGFSGNISNLWKETQRPITKKQEKASVHSMQHKDAIFAPHAFSLLCQATSIAFENKKKVTGIRISCKGRVGGRSKKAQRSRKDTLIWGETGLHVFSSKLDFAKTHAETPFGLVGVQVWVCTK